MSISFEEIVKTRRSANNFKKDEEITKAQLNEIFELVKLAPSAFNLQHAHYTVVLEDDVKKEQLQAACNGQVKVGTSSAVIAVLGDKEAHLHAETIFPGLDKEALTARVTKIKTFYESRGDDFKKEEAIRNSSLSAMQFMLCAKAKGFDTCPMIGYNKEKVSNILGIEERYELVMLITIGKEVKETQNPRAYRKPINDLVNYI